MAIRWRCAHRQWCAPGPSRSEERRVGSDWSSDVCSSDLFLLSLAAPHAELMAVVKANAYGHSLALCAPAVVRAGAKWLGVTSVEEGIVARALCPDARVLIIGGVFP